MASYDSTIDLHPLKTDPYGGLILRLGAYAIDCTLAFAVLVTPQIVLSLITGGASSGWLRTGPQLEAWVLSTVTLPVWLYFILSEKSTHQATIGKRLLGLYVTDVAGYRIGFRRAFLRTAVKMIPWELTHLALFFPTPIMFDESAGFRPALALVYLLMAIYLAAVFISPRNRSVHDFAAGTIVKRR